MLTISGPAAGFLTERVAPQHVVGFGVQMGAIEQQLQQLFSGSSNLVGTHQITVPVDNNWIFPATASLSLKLIANGQVVYQTPTSTVTLSQFQSGEIVIPIQLTSGVVSQLQGKQLAIGGELSFGAPSELWTMNLSFPGGS